MDITDKKVIKFKEDYNNIKNLTNNFKNFNYQLFKDNQHYIKIVRTILGLTTNRLSKKINIAYPWIYNLENNKNKMGERAAIKLTERFNQLYKSSTINFEEAVINFCSLNNKIISIKIPYDLNKLKHMTFKDFYDIYTFLKKETKNFSYIPPTFILEDSKIITVIRIISGLSQREFANKLRISKMTIGELENGYRKIKRPITANIYSNLLTKLFKENKLLFDKELPEKNWTRWKNTRKTKDKKNLKWKTIRNMNVEDFKNYFKSAKRLTNNFQVFDPKIFQQTPQSIMIFRILLGLTQRDLDRALNFKGHVISSYERITYKTLTIGRAELFSEFFKNKFKGIKNITKEFAIEKFLMCKDSMTYHRNSHLKILKNLKLTNQEEIILKRLKKLKNIKIESHSNIDTKKGVINVDFKIFVKNKPKFVIEATTFYHERGKKFGYNSKRKVLEIDYRFIKIKRVYPKINTILIINCDNDPLIKYKIKRLVKEETIFINNIFINDEVKNLKNLIGGFNGTK